jgi:tricorn protease-like protein
MAPIRAALVLSLAIPLLLAAPAQATFPGGKGRIAYSQGGGFSGPADSDPSGWTSAILDMSRSGGGERTLRSCLEHEGDFPTPQCPDENHSPSYSANGRLIAFDAGEGLAIMRADGLQVRPLPAYGSDDGEPAFSPDGRRLVFTGETHLYVVALTTGRVRQLTSLEGSGPAWSIRNRIAFESGGYIYSVKPNGKDLRKVTRGSDPDWSPDGRGLVFTRDLHLFVKLGPKARRVKSARGVVSNPVWSPDGHRIAYEAAEKGIYAVAPFGKKPQLLVESQAGDSGYSSAHEPAWQPRRWARG